MAKSKQKARKPKDKKRKQSAIAKSDDKDEVENPLKDGLEAFLQSVPKEDNENLFSPKFNPDRRGELWMAQAEAGEELVEKYAWAVPDDRAIHIIKQFAPLVEIGCGSNAYWCRLLQQHGIDIIGYDINLEDGGKIKGEKAEKGKIQKKKPKYIRKGGPDKLSSEGLVKSKRTLFLCYPDDEDMPKEDGDDEDDDDDDDDEPESMGSACLRNFQGTHVIHVGELFLDTNLSMDQAPWGRSSSSEFQEQLAAEYHCLLKARLPNFLHVRDTISVWKRSPTSAIVFAPDSDAEGDDEEEAEEVLYRHIPVEEQLPINVAAPCLQHLLKEPDSKIGSSDTQQEATPDADVPMEDPPTERAPKRFKTDKTAQYKSPW